MIIDKKTIDYVLAVVEILSLIFLIIYVIKTWQMASETKKSTQISEKTLKEMKESRAQEVAPYVIAYFNVENNSKICLIVKNIGKTVAENVKLDFTPELTNTLDMDLNEISLIKQGVSSMPPNYEIKTIYDFGTSYFKTDNMPLKYEVEITYQGGINNEVRKVKQTLDLSVYKELLKTRKKGMTDLVKKFDQFSKVTKKINKNIERINDRLSNGIWIKSSSFKFTNDFFSNNWRKCVKVIFYEFEKIWNYIYQEDRKELVSPNVYNLKNRFNDLGDKLLFLTSEFHEHIPKDLKEELIDISKKLFELSKSRIRSINEFNNSGEEIINEMQNLVKKLKIEFEGASNVR